MRVKLVFHGSYREVTGTQQECIELPEKANLLDLLKKLEELYGKELTGQLINYEKNEVWPLMAIAVNGKILSDLNKFTYSLFENDEVIFLPPALGG
ncbi:MAG: sulfur-carrier protein [Clostridia bacterium]|nr:sulfur-carrier protein [Clostridia bacterium]